MGVTMHVTMPIQTNVPKAHSILYKQDGTKRIGDNALVAMTLMVAESKPEEMEVMCKVVVNLI